MADSCNGDVIYVSVVSGLHAYDGTTGVAISAFNPVLVSNSNTELFGPVVYSNGVIYYSTTNTPTNIATVNAFNSLTGKKIPSIPQYSTTGYIDGMAICNSTMYVLTQLSGSISALEAYDVTTGQPLAGFTRVPNLLYAVGLAMSGSGLYEMSGADLITQFDGSTGSVIRSFTEGFNVGGTAIAISGTSLYLANNARLLIYEYDLNTGIAVPGFSSPTVSGARGLAVSGTTLYTVNFLPNGSVTALNATTGAFLAGHTSPSNLNYPWYIAAAAPLTAAETWRDQYFNTTGTTGNAAPNADPDHDGRNNLLEYATGSDPMVAQQGAATTLGTSADGARLTLKFHRTGDSTLIYTVLVCDDLSSWTPIWSSTGSQNVAGDVVVTDTELKSDHTARFLKLQITQ